MIQNTFICKFGWYPSMHHFHFGSKVIYYHLDLRYDQLAQQLSTILNLGICDWWLLIELSGPERKILVKI